MVHIVVQLMKQHVQMILWDQHMYVMKKMRSDEVDHDEKKKKREEDHGHADGHHDHHNHQIVHDHHHHDYHDDDDVREMIGVMENDEYDEIEYDENVDLYHNVFVY